MNKKVICTGTYILGYGFLPKTWDMPGLEWSFHKCFKILFNFDNFCRMKKLKCNLGAVWKKSL